MKNILVIFFMVNASIYGALQKVPGTLDISFGGNNTGFATFSFGGTDRIFSLAIDSQGRIVAGGQASGDTLIMRFTPDGLLDPTFGGNGTGFNIINLGGGFDRILSLAIDSQGRIVAGGGGEGLDIAFVMRFTPDGQLDLTFGESGTGITFVNLGGSDRIESLVLDTQERIVSAGSTGIPNAFVMRFTPDGVLDTTFGGSGTGVNIISITGGSEFFSIVLDDQQRPIAGGVGGPDDVGVVARFTPDGIIDTSFGSNSTGVAFLDVVGTLDLVLSIVIDAQGRIITGGGTLTGTFDTFVAAFTSGGELDTSFGGSGTGANVIHAGGSDLIQLIALDPQGRIVAVGGGDSSIDILVMRFTFDGVLDPTFGGNGTGVNLIDLGSSDVLFSVAVDAQGNFVAGGQAGSDALIMRFYNQSLTPLATALREKYCFT